jgi:hypothetical protein
VYYVAHRLFAAHDRALAAHIASLLAREAGAGNVFLPFCDTDEENLVSELKGRLLFVLDRSFISELVYGPLFHGRSRLSPPDAVSLAVTAASRGGVLVHLTGAPDAIVTRLKARDGTAPEPGTISAIINAYRAAFALLEDTAPVLVADTTNTP